jgi:hypothetical protein
VVNCRLMCDRLTVMHRIEYHDANSLKLNLSQETSSPNPWRTNLPSRYLSSVAKDSGCLRACIIIANICVISSAFKGFIR